MVRNLSWLLPATLSCVIFVAPFLTPQGEHLALDAFPSEREWWKLGVGVAPFPTLHTSSEVGIETCFILRQVLAAQPRLALNSAIQGFLDPQVGSDSLVDP